MSEAMPVPEDFHTITPHLVVRDAAQAVAFYEQALGAEELYRNLGPDGRSIVHSELRGCPVRRGTSRWRSGDQ